MSNFWKTFLAALSGTLAALILNVILFFVLIGAISAAVSSPDTVPAVPKNSILKIDLSMPIGERTTDGSASMDLGVLLNGMPQPVLGIRDAVNSIKAAIDDPAIRMILITNSYTTNSGLAALEELRAALAEFHDRSGKPIIAYGMNYSLGGYYISSVADRIYIHDDGSAHMVGLGSNMFFYKDLLDKLGIDVQLIRHGKFKSAAEQFIRSDISKENKLQNMEMLGSVWNNWAKTICNSRRIIPAELDAAIDNLKIGRAETLVENRLADSTISSTGMEQRLVELTGVKESRDLRFVSLMRYNKARTKSVSKSKNKIAILYAEGEITMNGTGGLAASRFIPVVKKIAADSSVKAVVFRVSSPGGDAQAAELIREAVQELRKNKPVISSFGEYAASGGYWITAQTDKIFSDANTLTGSIGVFSLSFNGGKGLKKHLHINAEPIGTHAHSTMGQMIEPLDKDEVEYMQTFVEQIYTKFTGIVADGRNMSVEKVDSIGQGRVWTGSQAYSINLVDRIGTLEDAIEAAAAACGLAGDSAIVKNYRIVEYPAVKSSMDAIMNLLGNGTPEDKDELNSSVNLSSSQSILSVAMGTSRFEGVTPALKALSPDEAAKTLFPDLYASGTARVYALMPCIYSFNY